jgi:hypothetical protein
MTELTTAEQMAEMDLQRANSDLELRAELQHG